jgi:hypothetical protein
MNYKNTAYILSCSWAGSTHGHFKAHKTCIRQEFPGRLHHISGYTTKFFGCNIRKFSSYNISHLLKRMCIAP